MIVPSASTSSRSRPSSAATSPDRAGRSYQATGRVCGIPLPAGPARERPPARADLHAGDQGGAGAHDENIDFDAMAATDAAVAARRTGPRRPPRPVPLRGGHRGAGRASSSPTRSSSSAIGRHGDLDRAHRRGPDARIRRGSGTPRRTSPAGRRPASTSSTCATGWRTSHGTRRPPDRRCPRSSSTGTRERYVEAFERITGASFERYLQEDVIAR